MVSIEFLQEPRGGVSKCGMQQIIVYTRDSFVYNEPTVYVHVHVAEFERDFQADQLT